MFYGHNIFFWIAVLGAGVLKLVLSPWPGALRSAIGFVAALFIAVIFTDPVLAYFNLNPDTYKNAVAALVTLTGEGVVRWLLKMMADPKKLMEWVRLIRGGGSK